MIQWWWALVAAVLAGPLWVVAALALTRRLWRNARKLSARRKGREQLVELGQLAGGLAHEIKNPLSTINVNLQLLSEDVARPDRDESGRLLRRLQSVQKETDRVRGILDDFLRYAGKYELNLESIDLCCLLGELADFFAPQADAARVIMRTDLPSSPVRCRGDANLLKQALLNLMINAVQATDAGGELIVRLSAGAGRASLEVIDTGRGIAKEDLDKLFQVYYSTKKGGTGLGLPTTRRIVREHGGSIRAESQPGTGTRFVISLPLIED